VVNWHRDARQGRARSWLGLPRPAVEWIVEEKYRAAKRSATAYRSTSSAACREFARFDRGAKRDFGRLGDRRLGKSLYTMAYSAEAQIVREIGKFLVNWAVK
jgi:isoleucyl-tRNA synthetase